MPVMGMHSIIWRITGLMFLAIFGTVVVLVYLANQQMTTHFAAYLTHPQHGHAVSALDMRGIPEEAFLQSIHQSLYFVGGGILLVGLGVSYLVARSITIPLRQLSAAAKGIAQGRFGETVMVERQDEIGDLADAFNHMSSTLAANNQLRQRFLADVAHELRTPLAILQGNLEGMLDGVVERSSEQLQSLYEETLHLNRLIKDLRELALAEVGQLTLEKCPVDLNGLVERALQLLSPLAEEKKIQLSRQLQPVPVVIADADRCNQVLYNLLMNALRYIPAGGSVMVSTAQVVRGKKPYVRLTVCDSGCGIAQADLPHLFQPFYRVDRSRNKQSGGTGLGLAIVKNLVELQGGFITVDSRLGEGSCFAVYLPLAEE